MSNIKNENWKKVERMLNEYISTLHDELGWFNDEEVANTPKRILNFYKEWANNHEFDFKIFSLDGTKNMVILKDISFYSMCAHHFLPFFGKAHIAYLPKEPKDDKEGKKIAGVSKLARAVNKFASKPTEQEKLSTEVVEYLKKELDTDFVMVVFEAQHLCMIMRGVKQSNSVMVTSDVRWNKERFDSVALGHLKDEALRLMGK